MLTLLLSILIVLLYAAFALLIVYVILFFAQKIFGPIEPRIVSLVYTIVALCFVIWLIQSFVAHAPIPTPWAIYSR